MPRTCFRRWALENLGGFPFWQLNFDENGSRTGQGANALVNELPAQGLTDLFIFSHGWNDSPADARNLYQRFFEQMSEVERAPVFHAKRPARIGTAGVIWPSMLWADESGGSFDGTASLAAPASDRELVTQLKAVYARPDQQAALDRLADLLERRPANEADLVRFQNAMRPLISEPDVTDAPEDNTLPNLLVNAPARQVFEQLAPAPETDARTADFGSLVGDSFRSVWEGAKTALRQATFWQTKKRAGVVGQRGLGPLIGDLHRAAPDLRIHLLGHSFGARLVSYALAGLPADAMAPVMAVKSVALLQGAFSHFAFSASLPFAPSIGGGLNGMQNRVDGPLIVTHSRLDLAVGKLYPLAALAAGDATTELIDALYRWQGMGYDGAQDVDAASALLDSLGTAYSIATGRFLNLDANHVITQGDPPAGAHSDIVHPQIAWAIFAAAGIV
jgi:hypothetical protein